jgi:hypothetical protein
MTPDERQSYYQDRQRTIAAKINALPEPARLLVLKYRRLAEFCGRADPERLGVDVVLEFVSDVEDQVSALRLLPFVDSKPAKVKEGPGF